MRRAFLKIAAAALILVFAGACASSLPPINLHLTRPVQIPEPKKQAKIIKDPETGKRGFFVPPEDMAADLKWKAAIKGEVEKGQINTDKANEAFKRLESYILR